MPCAASWRASASAVIPASTSARPDMVSTSKRCDRADRSRLTSAAWAPRSGVAPDPLPVPKGATAISAAAQSLSSVLHIVGAVGIEHRIGQTREIAGAQPQPVGACRTQAWSARVARSCFTRSAPSSATNFSRSVFAQMRGGIAHLGQRPRRRRQQRGHGQPSRPASAMPVRSRRYRPASKSKGSWAIF